MLTMSRKTWPVAASTALFMVAAGIAVATSVRPPQLAEPPPAAIDLVQAGGDCGDRNCDAWDNNPGTPGDPGGGGDTGGNDNGGGGGPCVWTGGGSITAADEAGQQDGLVLVAQTSVEVPCNHPVYGFYSGGCYYGSPPPLVEPPPPPDGQTAEDGAWYYQRCIMNAQIFNGELVFTLTADIQWRWFENGTAPIVLPTPEEVAQQVLATITLDSVDIRLAPPDTGAGLVDLPVWLGVESTTNSMGVIGAAGCDPTGLVCVTIEAEVVSIDWNLGDGTVITCAADDHTPWTPDMTYLAPGDHCHHYYDSDSRDQPDGRYQITATSNWEVRWEADFSDDGDVIEITRTAETSLEINEIQVLTR